MIAHTSQRYKLRKQLGVIMYKESYKLSHYERFKRCQPIRSTRDLPQPVKNMIPSKIDQDRQGKRTDKGWSSLLILDCQPDNDGVNPQQHRSQQPPDKFPMIHKTTRAMVTLEFNDQERKTCIRHKTICQYTSK